MVSTYFVIDGRSFFATVECAERGLDPMTTNLVVADPDRSRNTICLAVSPSMKALGVKNRCRMRDIPGNLSYIVAPPRMQLYIDYAAEIHGVFLKYFAPQDIYTYSIDESFIDATPYLKMYAIPARELAKRVIDDVRRTVGTISSCGIGTNMFLAKVALDILAKQAPDFIGELDENQYRQKLWEHRPITDFWGIGPGTEKRLRDRGITTMAGIARCDLDRIYDWFGIDGEILYDHAWGREPTTIADVKGYKAKAKSLSSGQILMRDYTYAEAETIVKEMMDQLCLDMAGQKLATDSVSLHIGYSHTFGIPGAGGTAQLSSETNAAAVILPAISALYRRIVNPSYGIRRVLLCCNNIVEDRGDLQLNMFQDTAGQLRSRALQEAMLGIRSKYGKNAILRGISYTPESTARERNFQIGGHKSGNENRKSAHVPVKTGKNISAV